MTRKKRQLLWWAAAALLAFGVVSAILFRPRVIVTGAPPTSTQTQHLPSETTLPPPTLRASDKPVILLYEDGFGGNLADPPRADAQLDVAVWGEGRIVWRAGNALLEGRVEAQQIDDLLQRLHRAGVFGTGKAAYGAFGPDSSFDVVEVRLPDRTLKLESWHEKYEGNPKVVVTSRGVEALEGRVAATVLAAEPPEYLRFRKIWSDIRSTVKSWVPSGGAPFSGTVPIDRDG